MDKIPDQNVPEESQIERMLGEIKPQPTTRLDSLMQNAPWIQASEVEKSKAPKVSKPTVRYLWATIGAAALLLLLAVLFIPSIRAIARQIINSFIYAPSNQLEVQVTLSNPNELFNYSAPSNFSLSVDQAEQAAGFKIKQLSNLPEGVALVGARYDAEYYVVTLLYQVNDYQLFLTQRPIGHGADVFSIGADVQVKLVQVSGVQAEYVVGGWKAIATKPAATGKTSTPAVSIRAVWDDTLPQSTLRWQVSGFVYELRGLGENGLSESDLINLANGLK